MNKTKVGIVDDESETIHGMLGITDTRVNELGPKLQKLFDEHVVKSNMLMPELFEEMSKLCNHPNELTWMSFMMGCNYESYEKHMRMKAIMSAFLGKSGL